MKRGQRATRKATPKVIQEVAKVEDRQEFVISCCVQGMTNPQIEDAYAEEFKEKIAPGTLRSWRSRKRDEIFKRRAGIVIVTPHLTFAQRLEMLSQIMIWAYEDERWSVVFEANSQLSEMIGDKKEPAANPITMEMKRKTYQQLFDVAWKRIEDSRVKQKPTRQELIAHIAQSYPDFPQYIN